MTPTKPNSHCTHANDPEHKVHNHNEHAKHQHSHKHHHHPQHRHDNLRTLGVSLVLISSFMVVEFVGGWLSNSLALLSDAGHMFSDAASLLLAFMALALGRRQNTQRHTFGLKRLEIFAALINGLTLLGIAIFICWEAIERLSQPQPIASLSMLVIACLGLGVNVFVAWFMHRGSDLEHNINMKGAYLHVLSDLLGSVAAIVAALLIMGFGWLWADPLTSLIVALLIIRGGWSVTRQSLHILMESTPKEIDPQQVVHLLETDSRIQSVHDLHLWSISSGLNTLSCHVVVNGDLRVSESTQMLKDIEAQLLQMQISHSIIQVESAEHGHTEELLCQLPTTILTTHSH